MSVSNMGIFSTNYKNPAIGGEKRTNADRKRSVVTSLFEVATKDGRTGLWMVGAKMDGGKT